MSEKAKSYKFKAEVNQLLDILVHSLYTNKEIFLRELISNASDALDKIRFELTSGADVADKNLDLEINIKLDKDKKLITISDTGIGMTKDEIIKNIGTIARSGSAEFLKQLAKDAEKKDVSNIIGKFGKPALSGRFRENRCPGKNTARNTFPFRFSIFSKNADIGKKRKGVNG